MKRLMMIGLLLLLSGGCARPQAAVPEPPAPPIRLAELWPGVPAHPDSVEQNAPDEQSYFVRVKAESAPALLAWYTQEMTRLGWSAEPVLAHVALFSRTGQIVSATVYDDTQRSGAILWLHRRESRELSQADAMAVAQRLVADRQRVMTWKQEQREVEPDEKGGRARSAWVVEAIFPAGNKTVVYVDTLTAEPFRVATIEGPGWPDGQQGKPITSEEAIAIVVGRQVPRERITRTEYLADYGPGAWKVIITNPETNLSHYYLIDAFSGTVIGMSSPRSGQ